LRLVSLTLKVTFLFLSPLVLYCAEGDGFIKEEGKTWVDIVDPKLQASYEEYQRNERERKQFSKDIARFATLKKKTFDLVALIHQFNLRGPHFDPTKFDELTKWMRMYEKEILIAMDNYDAEAYVFFFEEFAKLTIRRAGMVNPNCDIKDCECRNYNN
tara:strand:+ start:159 stop:632 length:474 start_codon:yes stop_codon:yes gene_type:complete